MQSSKQRYKLSGIQTSIATQAIICSGSGVAFLLSRS